MCIRDSIDGASNWLFATSSTNWDQEGVYSGAPTSITVTTQSFDNGNEDIDMDITDEVNSLITGGTTNYGYGLSFERGLEDVVRSDAQYVGFFKEQTQTYYQPFVETIYNNPIRDDRNRFYKGKSNKLYLYVNVGGQLTNLDYNPGVTIRDEDGDVFTGVTSAQTTHVSTGVYSVSLNVPVTNEDCVLYTDTWSGLTINGVDRTNVTLDFEIKDDEEFFDLGTNVNEPVCLLYTSDAADE